MSIENLFMNRAAVLLGTYNGEKWILDQINSILDQKNIDVDIYISDDSSNDLTLNVLEKIKSPRIKVLPPKKFNSPAKNFYRLFQDVNFGVYDFVALSDQDDIWMPNKLERALGILDKTNSMGYSTDFFAFWEDSNKKILISKPKMQKKYDYLFESAGPGFTYVLRSALARFIQEKIKNNLHSEQLCGHHDWLIYAIARKYKYKWAIDNFPSALYRQHSCNAEGVNRGYRAFIKRLGLINSGYFINQAFLISNAVEDNNFFNSIVDNNKNIKFKYVKYFLSFRKSNIDALLLLIFLVNSFFYKIVKRVLDIFLSLTGIIILSPLFFLVSIIVFLSGWPIIHLSKRVGVHNKIFNMPKFRTMVIQTPNVATDKLKKPENYLTFCGKFLRKSSLDELPQLYSVLVGDMTIVGPRPALYNQHELIKLRTQYSIHILKPGITGYAQINGRDEVSINKKVRLDRFYLMNKSFALDIKIITITFAAIVSSRNVKH